MSLKHDTLVEVPKSKVQVRTVGGYKYAYYATRCYRNEKGNPTCDRISIGKIDEATGKLIPNRNYYEVFKKEPAAFMDTIAKCGTYGVFKHIAADTGLSKIIDKCFPGDLEAMLTCAHYMLCGESSMYLLEDWMDDHITFNKSPLRSAEISRLFEKIDIDTTTRFFKDWIKIRSYKELIAYDVTSISTYSRGIENAEWGYNRDKEEIPQINYGMFYGQESLLPLYYRVYPGSITDKAHLEYMAGDTELLDMKKAYFVMDRGFFSADNLKLLSKNLGIRFVISVPPCNYFDDMVDKHKDEIINNYACAINNGEYYGKCYENNHYGFRMNTHVFYNPDKASNMAPAFFKKIDQWSDDLSKMTKMPSKTSNYAKYFNITQKKGYLVFKKNIEEINKELTRLGFFIIAETVFTKTTADVLDIYRHRDTIEKCFDDLKNELDLKRLRCHNGKTVEGKMFVAFLALIIKSAMTKELKQYMQDKNMSFNKIIYELDKIKLIYAPANPSGYRLLNNVTKTQREILEHLGMDENFVDNLV